MRTLRFVLVLLVVVISILLHVGPLLLAALIKALVPLRALRRFSNRMLTGIAESWIGFNNFLWPLVVPTRVVVEGAAGLRRDGHYLVLANHQSWVDILVMQKVLNRRIPLMRFFLKRQLIWVPLLGLAWWALDFPFMGRYTPHQIARNPALAGRDIEATRRACEKFRELPVAIMNFAEGTRFTPAKRVAQHSPYQRLLKPKSGGVAFVLNAMGEALEVILDLTIAYPTGVPSMADLLSGRIPEIRLRIRERPIPRALAQGDYQSDRALRIEFQRWMNGLWAAKDADLECLLSADRAPAVEGERREGP